MDRHRSLLGSIAALWLAAVFIATPCATRAAGCVRNEQPLDALGFPDAMASDPSPVSVRWMRNGEQHWIRAETAGGGTLAVIRSARPAPSPVDLTGHFLRLELRLTGPGRLGGMEVRLGSGEEWNDYFLFTFPIYDDPRFDPLQPGEWLATTLSFARAQAVGNPDRSALRWLSVAFRDAGSAPLRIEWRRLGAIPEPERGVLSFTFDDGYDEHLDAARMMAAHGFAGTAYVMPDQIGEPGYLTLPQLQMLEREYGWDVAAHHAVPLTDFENGDLERTLRGVREYLDAGGFRGAGHLAYPLGRHDPLRVVPATRRFFETARVASAGPETLPPADPYRLRAINVLGTHTRPEDLATIARDARLHKHWAILMFHYLVPGVPAHDLEYNKDDFERALAQIQETGVEVKTITEVWSEVSCR